MTPNPLDSVAGGYCHLDWEVLYAGIADAEVSAEGWFTVEDATIDGIVGTGDLKIFNIDHQLRIISGTGDFKGIKRTGTYERDSVNINLILHYESPNQAVANRPKSSTDRNKTSIRLHDYEETFILDTFLSFYFFFSLPEKSNNKYSVLLPKLIHKS